MTNGGGISSLGGFAYQIKVFVYYLEKLQENMEIGYETFEDVSLKYKPEDFDYIDNKCSNFNSIYKTTKGITAIQVKKAKLDEKDYNQLLYNWLLLEMSDDIVNKYILFMDKSYNNADLIFKKAAHDMYLDILTSCEPKSLKYKVKLLVDGKYKSFEDAYNNIKEKYDVISIENIDIEIDKVYNRIFHKPSVGSIIFNLRLRALLEKCTVDIMENAVKNKSFTCSYEYFNSVIENITVSINEKEFCMDFSLFRDFKHVNLKETQIAQSRQYKQLCSCFPLESKIEEHLIYEEYYNDYKLRSLENMKKSKIDNIEITTYSNFTDAKLLLLAENKDIPLRRLDETKRRSNSYSYNEQIYYGSAIHLTKSDTVQNLLISWKDEEENE